MTSLKKGNYAYEIRFVDDKVVQLYDIAAKRKQESGRNALPVEYPMKEVLKGQLRYSKLIGGSPSPSTEYYGMGMEDDGRPYQHNVTTKKSANRRSVQRHTFFMMGGGDDGSVPNSYYDFDNDDDDCSDNTNNRISSMTTHPHLTTIDNVSKQDSCLATPRSSRDSAVEILSESSAVSPVLSEFSEPVISMSSLVTEPKPAYQLNGKRIHNNLHDINNKSLSEINVSAVNTVMNKETMHMPLQAVNEPSYPLTDHANYSSGTNDSRLKQDEHKKSRSCCIIS